MATADWRSLPTKHPWRPHQQNYRHHPSTLGPTTLTTMNVNYPIVNHGWSLLSFAQSCGNRHKDVTVRLVARKCG
jgi:hypothetical protein